MNTTRAVRDLAAREGVEMPISEGVYQLLFEGVHARDAVYALMGRKLKPEVV